MLAISMNPPGNSAVQDTDRVRKEEIKAVWARKNPFLGFVGKPYGAYHYALRDTLRIRYDLKDPALVAHTVEQMRELPDVLHDKQWEIEADYMTANFVHDYQGGDSAKFRADLLRMLDMSRRAKNKIWEVRIIRRLFDFSMDYDLVNGISYARQLEKALEGVTDKEYPDVVDCKFRLGMMYLTFKDFHRAEKYFKLVVGYPVNNEIQPVFIHSRNNLGLIYRDYYRNYDVSDSWFRSIYDFRDRYGIKEVPEQWNAIVLGNLGKNQLLRGRYAVAEPMMRRSFEVMYREKDYRYSFSMATYLVDAYCQLKRFDEARQFLELADSCECREGGPLLARKQDYYVAACKYFAATGRPELSAAYVDSAAFADVDYNRHYDRSRFLQIEQRQGQLEWQLEADRAEENGHWLALVTGTSVVVLMLCLVSLTLYVRERKANKMLLLKNKEWAKRSRTYEAMEAESRLSVEDKSTVQTVLNYMESSQCYLNSDLTLDILARDLGINRTYLSRAVNEIDENFKSFVNKYRVQHAIKMLMEDPEANMEDVALKVGFNSRKSFYNSFTAITGLPPVQFRKRNYNANHANKH